MSGLALYLGTCFAVALVLCSRERKKQIREDPEAFEYHVAGIPLLIPSAAIVGLALAIHLPKMASERVIEFCA